LILNIKLIFLKLMVIIFSCEAFLPSGGTHPLASQILGKELF
jgi:hypothetical protein